MIFSKETIRTAIQRAMELGAASFEEACESVAQSHCIPVEQVREAAYQDDAQEGGAS
jgi:hypothetical protein